MSKNTMLIEFKGRKSGRMFTTPVSYHIEGDRVHCFTSQEFGWWRNLVDAKKVVLTLKGDRIVGAPTVWVDEPEKITVFDLPEHHRRRLRTTNVLERLNREIKRRTAVATLFPNEASLLRLVTALVAEVSDEWEIGRAYLIMESE